MNRPLLLDLFSGGGGAGFGYYRAGFTVIGVDICDQPHYPFGFIKADALEYIREFGHLYDAIHASPPCQAHSVLRKLHKNKEYPDLIEPTRAALIASGKPYVMENVVGAPMQNPLMLCGSMFGLQTKCGAQLRRHRLFECSFSIEPPCSCNHGSRSFNSTLVRLKAEQRGMKPNRTIMVVGDTARDPLAERKKYRNKTITVTGSTPQQNVVRNTIRDTFTVGEARTAMGIDWLPMSRLSQAIPPAYTFFIGTRLIRHLRDTT